MSLFMSDQYFLAYLEAAGRQLKSNDKTLNFSNSLYHFAFQLMPEMLEGRRSTQASLYRVTVYRVLDQSLDKIVLKKPLNFNSDEMGLRTEIYSNEFIFYTKIYTALKTLENVYRIQPSRIPVPDCITCDIAANNLFLRDLSLDRFRKQFNDELLDEEHIKLVFKAYGYFHACSFCVKHINPNLFHQELERLHKILETHLFLNNLALFVTNGIKDTLKVLDSFTQRDIISKLEKYSSHASEIIFDCFKYQGEYGCLLHGNCNLTNIMFKYDRYNQVEDVKLVDFKLVRFGSPVHDLSEFFYTAAAEAEIHLDNLQIYLQDYYDAFSATAVLLGQNPNQLFPQDKFEEEWRLYSKSGMLMALGSLRDKYNQNIVQNAGAMEEQKHLFTYFARALMDHMQSHDAL